MSDYIEIHIIYINTVNAMLEYCKKCLLHHEWRLEHPKTKADSNSNKKTTVKLPTLVLGESFVLEFLPYRHVKQFEIIKKYVDTINTLDVKNVTVDTLDILKETLFQHTKYIEENINEIGIQRAEKNKHLLDATQKGYPGTYWVKQLNCV